MDKIIKAKWVAALRSGVYVQGRNALRKGNSFCCLGVLCDIYAAETNKGHWDDVLFVTGEEENPVVDMDVLPFEVWKWAGISSANPYLTDPNRGKDRELAAINDDGADFESIATIIETEL